MLRVILVAATASQLSAAARFGDQEVVVAEVASADKDQDKHKDAQETPLLLEKAFQKEEQKGEEEEVNEQIIGDSPVSKSSGNHAWGNTEGHDYLKQGQHKHGQGHHDMTGYHGHHSLQQEAQQASPARGYTRQRDRASLEESEEQELTKARVAGEMAGAMVDEGERVALDVQEDLDQGADRQLASVQDVLASGVSSAQKLANIMALFVSSDDLKAAQAGRSASKLVESKRQAYDLKKQAKLDRDELSQAFKDLSRTDRKLQEANKALQRKKAHKIAASQLDELEKKTLTNHRNKAEKQLEALKFKAQKSQEAFTEATHEVTASRENMVTALLDDQGEKETLQAKVADEVATEDQQAMEVGRLVVAAEKAEARSKRVSKKLDRITEHVKELRKAAKQTDGTAIDVQVANEAQHENDVALNFWEVHDEAMKAEKLVDAWKENRARHG